MTINNMQKDRTRTGIIPKIRFAEHTWYPSGIYDWPQTDFAISPNFELVARILMTS